MKKNDKENHLIMLKVAFDWENSNLLVYLSIVIFTYKVFRVLHAYSSDLI